MLETSVAAGRRGMRRARVPAGVYKEKCSRIVEGNGIVRIGWRPLRVVKIGYCPSQFYPVKSKCLSTP